MKLSTCIWIHIIIYPDGNLEILEIPDTLFLGLFRQELDELKVVHAQCGEYAREQTTLIQNLQSLQDQTQTGS